MPLRCDIFYVAGICPALRAARLMCCVISGQFPGWPCSQPPPPATWGGTSLPPFPRYGLIILLYSCHGQALCIAADGAFAPPALPQPAALRISLHPHRTAFRSQCTRLRLVRLSSGHPTSTAGSHNGFCDKPCIAHRNQPLPFLLISL